MLLALTPSLLATLSGTAEAQLTVALHDQGADPAVLDRTAEQLGARTVRLVARTGEAQLEEIRAARAAGRMVQVAVEVQRDTHAGDLRRLVRQWDGMVGTVSIGNEPEINGHKACGYARIYRRAYRLIRREHPKMRIGFGELSPWGTIEYVREVLACPGPRIRADFLAVHPYQFAADPLTPWGRDVQTGLGPWFGIGRLAEMHRLLRQPTTRRRLSTPGMRALPVRCTEFAYLTTGRWGISEERAAWLWPRAVQQARKWCQQLVVYGIGAVHPDSGWGSAALLDRFGRVTPAFHMLAQALGRPAPRDRVPVPAPAGDLVTALPSGVPRVAHPLPVVEIPPLEGIDGVPVDKPIVAPVPGAAEPPVKPVEAPAEAPAEAPVEAPAAP